MSDHKALPWRLDQATDLQDVGRIASHGPLSGGHGRPIVVFHGIYGGASHRIVLTDVDELDRRVYRVWLMDLPRIGASATPRRGHDIEVLEEFVASFLREGVKVRDCRVLRADLRVRRLCRRAGAPAGRDRERGQSNGDLDVLGRAIAPGGGGIRTAACQRQGQVLGSAARSCECAPVLRRAPGR